MKSPLRVLVGSFLAFGAFILLAVGTSSAQAESGAGPRQTTATNETTPMTEVYGTASDGTVLHWVVYTPSTPGPGRRSLSSTAAVSDGSPARRRTIKHRRQDLAAAGYIAFSIEYRLAPPGALPGQISDGRFPDQSDDVKLAMRTARADPRCNGQVGAWWFGRWLSSCLLCRDRNARATTAWTSVSVSRERMTFRISARIPGHG